MAKEFGNDAKQAVQKSGTQVLDAASTLKGMNAAKMAAQQTAAGLDGTKLTDKQIASVGNQAARQFQAQKLAQNFKDGMFERLTGQKADAPNDGLMKVGRTYFSHDGHQIIGTNRDVNNQSNKFASKMGADKMQPYVDQAKNHGETTTNMNNTGSYQAEKQSPGMDEASYKSMYEDNPLAADMMYNNLV